jgi:phosphoglycolate phosphatase-like HAD superfamily hydrolase
VERTKPAPDLVKAALELVGGGPGIMIGDSTWDVEAAKKLKVPTICVRTGGFGADELREAGAEAVFESIEELRERLGGTGFG